MGKKIHASMVLIFTLVTLVTLAMATASCGSSSTRQQPAPAPTRVSTPTPVPPTRPPQRSDLQIIDVKLEKSNQRYDYRVFAVNVKNNEAGEAQGFDISCTWQCPAGLTISAGTSVVQAGYLAGGSQRMFRREDRVQCDGPPAVLNNVVCTVDINHDVAETNEQNNQWRSQLNVPF